MILASKENKEQIPKSTGSWGSSNNVVLEEPLKENVEKVKPAPNGFKIQLQPDIFTPKMSPAHPSAEFKIHEKKENKHHKENQEKNEEKKEEKQVEKQEEKQEVAAIDKSTSQTLLISWVRGTPIDFLHNSREVKQSVPVVQQSEKSTLKREFPKIQQPTGLPPVKKQTEKDESLPFRQDPVTFADNRGVSGTLHHPEEQQVSDVPVNQQSPPDFDINTLDKQDEGSWLKHIFRLIQSYLSSVSTVDPTITTSIGPRPKVQLVGDADPSANETQLKDSTAGVETEKQKANEEITKDFGENNIFPQVTPVEMTPNVMPGPPPLHAGNPSKVMPAVSNELSEEFNFNAQDRLSEEGNAAIEKTESEKMQMDADSMAERSKADSLIEEETKATRKDQIHEQKATQKAVDVFRNQWMDENETIHADFTEKADSEKSKVDKLIKDQTSQADDQINKEFNTKEEEIRTKKQAAEADAARKKREEENRPKSYWERIKGAVKSVLSAIRSAINAIFNVLRDAVKVLINVAKKAAYAIIEVARMAIVGAIKGFGVVLKGLVTVTFALFPRVAKKINAKIDQVVDDGVESVNRAANILKDAVANILDALGEALDSFLSVFQTAFNLALDILEFLTVGLLSILEFLANIKAMYQKFKKLINGIQDVWNDPAIIENYVQEFLRPYINGIPEEVRQQLFKGFSSAGKSIEKHLSGIWKYLTPVFTYLAANWWSEIKKMAWFMIWPFAEGSPVYEDAPKLWKLLPQIWKDVSKGNFSRAMDGGIEWMQALNNTVAAFTGWIYVGSILIGAIVGAFFGGAGAIPGAMAGLEVANSIGMGMLISMMATEGTAILKAIYDLFVTEDEGGDGSAIKAEKEKEDPSTQRVLLLQIPAGGEEHQVNLPHYTSSNVETGHDRVEYAYSRIANSGFALAVMAVFFILGSIGGKIAQALGKFGKAVGKVAAKVAPKTTRALSGALRQAKTFAQGVGEKYGYKNFGPVKGSAKGNAPKGNVHEGITGEELHTGDKQHIDTPETKPHTYVSEQKPTEVPEIKSPVDVVEQKPVDPQETKPTTDVAEQKPNDSLEHQSPEGVTEQKPVESPETTEPAKKPTKEEQKQAEKTRKQNEKNQRKREVEQKREKEIEEKKQRKKEREEKARQRKEEAEKIKREKETQEKLNEEETKQRREKLAQELLSEDGKFKDPDLESKYSQYLNRKHRASETPRDRIEWKEVRDYWQNDSPIARGNDFNRKAVDESWYPYDEVNLENGKRLDSYNPDKGEIVSRKATDFDVISEGDFKEYLNEFKEKYAEGTKIRSNKYLEIDGQQLKGKYILEVPESNAKSDNFTRFKSKAEAAGIEIRLRPE